MKVVNCAAVSLFIQSLGTNKLDIWACYFSDFTPVHVLSHMQNLPMSFLGTVCVHEEWQHGQSDSGHMTDVTD